MTLRHAADIAITNKVTTRVIEVACPYYYRPHCHDWDYTDPEPGVRISPCTDDTNYFPTGPMQYLIAGFRGRFVDSKAKR